MNLKGHIIDLDTAKMNFKAVLIAKNIRCLNIDLKKFLCSAYLDQIPNFTPE